MDDWEMQALAAYVADYIMEEQARGNVEIDKYMVRDAFDAYFDYWPHLCRHYPQAFGG